MRKKLDTRFPAARIKKIMQADEDVGKIALAVPVLVSKALELFLQDLCDRTYEITLQRGAKTMNSLHLKHCVQSFNVFDFLKEIVRKVPDYGHSDASAEDRAIPKRRKAAGGDEINESDEESKRSKTNEVSHASGTGRGRGRGRGRSRGRSARVADKDHAQHEIETDPCASIPSSNTKQIPFFEPSEPKNPLKDDMVGTDSSSSAIRNFDLNADLDENESATTTTATMDVSPAAAAHPISTAAATEAKHEEFPGWSEVDRMSIDPLQYANINSRLDEEEEDYDEEM